MTISEMETRLAQLRDSHTELLETILELFGSSNPHDVKAREEAERIAGEVTAQIQRLMLQRSKAILLLRASGERLQG